MDVLLCCKVTCHVIMDVLLCCKVTCHVIMDVLCCKVTCHVIMDVLLCCKVTCHVIMDVLLYCKVTCHVIMSKNSTHASSCRCFLVTPRLKIERVEFFMEHQISAADLGWRLATTGSSDRADADWASCANSCADDQQNRYHGEWPLQCELSRGKAYIYWGWDDDASTRSVLHPKWHFYQRPAPQKYRIRITDDF